MTVDTVSSCARACVSVGGNPADSRDSFGVIIDHTGHITAQPGSEILHPPGILRASTRPSIFFSIPLVYCVSFAPLFTVSLTHSFSCQVIASTNPPNHTHTHTFTEQRQAAGPSSLAFQRQMLSR